MKKFCKNFQKNFQKIFKNFQKKFKFFFKNLGKGKKMKKIQRMLLMVDTNCASNVKQSKNTDRTFSALNLGSVIIAAIYVALLIDWLID